VTHVLAKESWSDRRKCVVSFAFYQDHSSCSLKLSVIVLSVAAAVTTTRGFGAKVRVALKTLKQEAHNRVSDAFRKLILYQMPRRDAARRSRVV
jgi:hypothetical protein